MIKIEWFTAMAVIPVSIKLAMEFKNLPKPNFTARSVCSLNSTQLKIKKGCPNIPKNQVVGYAINKISQ